MTTTTQIPQGYLMNAKGDLIAESNVKEIDKLRDEVVKKMTAKAKDLNSHMKTTKAEIFNDFEDFIQLSAQVYDTKIGGEKGNTTLMSFDGSQKIQLAISDNLVFDERLQVAKKLVDECIHEWSEGVNDNIKSLITGAFDVDKEGKINTRRILGLRSLKITDAKWLKAMNAISDATQIVSSKEYIRVYERDENGKYQQISLDFSNV